MGSLLGVQPLDDPNRTKVDMIAESLGLERVAYIFTSLNKEKQFVIVWSFMKFSTITPGKKNETKVIEIAPF